jgi:hypothetical protein
VRLVVGYANPDAQRQGELTATWREQEKRRKKSLLTHLLEPAQATENWLGAQVIVEVDFSSTVLSIYLFIYWRCVHKRITLNKNVVGSRLVKVTNAPSDRWPRDYGLGRPRYTHSTFVFVHISLLIYVFIVMPQSP